MEHERRAFQQGLENNPGCSGYVGWLVTCLIRGEWVPRTPTPTLDRLETTRLTPSELKGGGDSNGWIKNTQQRNGTRGKFFS